MVDTDLRLDRTSRVGVSVLKSGEPDPVRNRYFRDILCLDLTECPLGVLQKRVGIAAHPALLIAFSGCKCLDGDCFVLRAFLVQDDRPLVAAAFLRRFASIEGIVDPGVLYVFTLRRIHRQGYLRAVRQLLAVRIVRLWSVQLYAFFPTRCIGGRLCHRCIDVKLLLLLIPAEEPVAFLLRLVDLHGIEIIALVDRLRRSLRYSPVGIEGNGHRRYCIVERSDLTVCISAPDGDRPDRGFLPDRNACIDIVFQRLCGRVASIHRVVNGRLFRLAAQVYHRILFYFSLCHICRRGLHRFRHIHRTACSESASRHGDLRRSECHAGDDALCIDRRDLFIAALPVHRRGHRCVCRFRAKHQLTGLSRRQLHRCRAERESVQFGCRTPIA